MTARRAVRIRPSFWMILSIGCGILCLDPAPLVASCNSPANPIEKENCLPGNPPSQWNIAWSGDTSIQGFATDISVNEGQRVFFKVNTDAKSYQLDIYRMGYYGGNGARLVTTVLPSVPLPQIQPACISDSATLLLDCGNWGVSASWKIPGDATSGIYFARLVRADTNGASHVFFIVRNDAGKSDLVFQTSDLAWQAYNDYGAGGAGGASLYGCNGVFNVPCRAYKVSYNRPFYTGSFSPFTWVFNAEYPMVRWLEANGYDVSYISGVDTDRNGSLLLRNHKVYMSVGHDEYWSGNQRTNVEAARAAGVHLAFFSGNEIFWKTRWENAIDGSGTPYRTLVCYKETAANAVIDPDDPPTWTGTWRDPRFSPPADGGRPENALSGTLSEMNGPISDNIIVPQDDGRMRFWRNTSIASLAAGQTYVMPLGTLGYEWDVDADNGFRPAGLFHLSTATVTTSTDCLLDYGNIYGACTLTHHLDLYRYQGEGLVFGAGTVQWSWGLDSNDFNGSAAPDPNMQQATVNLFADMDVQPATLQAGLVKAQQSTDTKPPTSIITSPGKGAQVPVGQAVTIAGTAADAGGGVVGGVEVSVDNGTTWHPATGRENWSYLWTATQGGQNANLRSRAVDDSGNLETPSSGIVVTVAPGSAQMIWGNTFTPSRVDSGDTNAYELGVKFRSDISGSITALRFYKAAANTGTHIGHLWTASGIQLASVTFTNESASGWQQATLSTPVAISANETYIASYWEPNGHWSLDNAYFTVAHDNPPLHALADGTDGPNGVYNYQAIGFPLSTYQQSNYWVDVVFSSASAPPTPALSVSATALSFSTVVGGSNPSNQSFTVSNSNGSTLSWTGTKTQNWLSFSPTSGGNGPTTVTVSANSQGLAAGTYNDTITISDPNAPNSPQTVGVTLTISPQSTGAQMIWGNTFTPSRVDSGDTNAYELGVKFRSDISGSITALRFYKAAANTGTHIGHLWTASGIQLASVTFTNESASGWQQATLSTPVAISANTTYIASYWEPNGHWSLDNAYFTVAHDNPPLHALADGTDGPNGVYNYQAIGFPLSTYQQSNYWVDVLFSSASTP